MELLVPGFYIWLTMDQQKCNSQVTHDDDRTSWKLGRINILLKNMVNFGTNLPFQVIDSYFFIRACSGFSSISC